MTPSALPTVRIPQQPSIATGLGRAQARVRAVGELDTGLCLVAALVAFSMAAAVLVGATWLIR